MRFQNKNLSEFLELSLSQFLPRLLRPTHNDTLRVTTFLQLRFHLTYLFGLQRTEHEIQF